MAGKVPYNVASGQRHINRSPKQGKRRVYRPMIFLMVFVLILPNGSTRLSAQGKSFL